MKSYFRIFGFLLVVCMTFSLLGCVVTPAESGSEPAASSDNVQRIDEMIGKLESAAVTATANLNDSVAVLTADFEAKQKDPENVVAQMNAAHTAWTAALAAQIQTLKNVDTNNTEAVAAAIAEAEALISEERHIYGDPIEHSRTSDCSSCDEKDIYQICTICNALKWGKMEHTLELCYDMSMHWNRCLRCDKAMPRWEHDAGVDGKCTECPYVVNVKILIIEKYDGESETLRGMIDDRHTVSVLNVDDAPTTVEALTQYDEVILVNVAYADMPAGFEELLHRYVYDMGGGVLTVGGQNDMVNGQIIPHAYNRSDIAQSTYYKNMLPVQVNDFHEPVAVMLVIDRSSSVMSGMLIPGSLTDPGDATQPIDVIQDAAMGILDILSDNDYCGVINMQATSELKSPFIPASQKYDLMHAICDSDMEDNHGGTILSGAVVLAGEKLAELENVASKHIIVFTDGNFGDPYDIYSTYIEENLSRGITMSIVTVNMYDENIQGKLEKAVELGGGKYYNIDIDEIRQAAVLMGREFSIENSPEIRYGQPFGLAIGDITAAVEDVDPAQLSGLTGYYVTQLKEGAMAPLVCGWIPIYAQWEYGEGTVCSFMCDLSGEWSADLVASEPGATIINNIISVLANTLAEENSQNEQ